MEKVVARAEKATENLTIISLCVNKGASITEPDKLGSDYGNLHLKTTGNKMEQEHAYKNLHVGMRSSKQHHETTASSKNVQVQ